MVITSTMNLLAAETLRSLLLPLEGLSILSSLAVEAEAEAVALEEQEDI
jgi:hypothetical protein